eukprot:gene13669-biopygen10839
MSDMGRIDCSAWLGFDVLRTDTELALVLHSKNWRARERERRWTSLSKKTESSISRDPGGGASFFGLVTVRRRRGRRGGLPVLVQPPAEPLAAPLDEGAGVAPADGDGGEPPLHRRGKVAKSSRGAGGLLADCWRTWRTASVPGGLGNLLVGVSHCPNRSHMPQQVMFPSQGRVPAITSERCRRLSCVNGLTQLTQMNRVRRLNRLSRLSRMNWLKRLKLIWQHHVNSAALAAARARWPVVMGYLHGEIFA